MGRKRKPSFDWTAEEGVAGERGEREDRKALKARLAVAERTVRDMAALPKPGRDQLPLPEETLEALEVYVALRPGPALARQLAYVRGLLRDEDLDALGAAVEKIRKKGLRG
jgi:ribosomal 50S subunit-associated protein YjgA (DUF615 family)